MANDNDNGIISPRLAALYATLREGDRSALDRFWSEVESEGAPLIEPIEGDRDNVLVTFLWRETEPVTNVAVIGELTDFDPEGKVMDRLPGSDLLYKTYRWRNDLRTCYELSPNDPLTPAVFGDEHWEERTQTWQPDPLNPRRYQVNVRDPQVPGSRDKWLSVLELPGAPPQPWVEPRPEGLAGKLEFHRLHSDILGDERRVWVYSPPGVDGQECALLVMTDAVPYTRLMMAQITLDNLQIAGKIPPTVGVFVDNPNRYEDLACNPLFVDFLAREVVPWARQNYPAANDAARTVIGGTSLGGLTAAFAALRHPAVFGKVISQSGAFQWSPEGDPEEEWLARQYVDASTGAITFFLDAGLLELTAWGPGSPSLLVANRHLRDVLRAKGYTVHYMEFNGGHNYIVWQGTLAEELITLLGSTS